MLHVSSLELLIMGNFILFVLIWMKFLADSLGQIGQLRRLRRLINFLPAFKEVRWVVGGIARELCC